MLGPKLCLSVDVAGGVSYPWVDGPEFRAIRRGTPQGKLARSPKPAANGRQLESCSHDRHEVKRGRAYPIGRAVRPEQQGSGLHPGSGLHFFSSLVLWFLIAPEPVKLYFTGSCEDRVRLLPPRVHFVDRKARTE